MADRSEASADPVAATRGCPAAEGAAGEAASARAAVGSWLFYAVSLCVLGLDQLSKYYVQKLLPFGSPSWALLGSWVRLTLTRNTGAAFGLFPTSTVLLAVVAVIIIVWILVFASRGGLQSRLLAVALGLELGGALGNLIDRARLGYVIDFVDLRFWPVFNLADSAITVGAIALAWYFAFPARRARGD